MSFEATAIFPGAIPTEADLGNWKNNARGSLAANITAAALSFSLGVGEGAKYPADSFFGTFEGGGVREILKISSRSGDTFTVAAGGRGQDGTTAQAWNAGTIFELRPIAKNHNQVIADLNAGLAFLGVQGRNVFRTKPRTVSADFSYADDDGMAHMTTGGTNRTGTLPTAVGRLGQIFGLMKMDAGAGKAILATTGGQTINDQAGWELVNKNDFVWLQSDNANWRVIGKS